MDGFRFDLASILVARRVRAACCRIRRCCGTSSRIRCWPGTKLIAEAWDAAGLYQVGQLRRRQLEGVERPLPRRRPQLLPRRTQGRCGAFADRFVGSPEIYGHKEREPEQSINFVTCHDGFTLNDLVSYNRKHNEANGEDNRDGGERQPELELRRRRARPTTRRSRSCAIGR